MKKNKLIIVGSSGHAKVVIDIFEKQESHGIVGLLDDFRNVGEETLGYKILGGLKDLGKLKEKYGDFDIFVAIGDNWARKAVVDKIKSVFPEINFATAIHPSAQIGKGVNIGKGVAIMPNVVINSDARIGDFTFLNTKSSADHDVILNDFSSLGPGSTLGGNVEVGEFSYVSIGAIVREKIKIGKHSIIGSGALLLSDCPDNVVMYGVPAKIIRNRNAGEKYLL